MNIPSSLLATTPLPPCPPTPTNSSTILYSNGASSIAYRCNSFAWQAPTTATVSLTFQMRHDPDYWYLDDVSVLQGSTEMLNNGGFETGSFSPWTTSAPNGCGAGYMAQVWTSFPHNGSYAVRDGCNGQIDRISQSFSALAGQIYVVSFWMKSNHTGSSVIANVTLF